MSKAQEKSGKRKASGGNDKDPPKKTPNQKRSKPNAVPEKPAEKVKPGARVCDGYWFRVEGLDFVYHLLEDRIPSESYLYALTHSDVGKSKTRFDEKGAYLLALPERIEDIDLWVEVSVDLLFKLIDERIGYADLPVFLDVVSLMSAICDFWILPNIAKHIPRPFPPSLPIFYALTDQTSDEPVKIVELTNCVGPSEGVDPLQQLVQLCSKRNKVLTSEPGGRRFYKATETIVFRASKTTELTLVYNGEKQAVLQEHRGIDRVPVLTLNGRPAIEFPFSAQP